MKKTAQLTLLETTIKELGYTIRYEKGNFLGGECRLREDKVVVVNKFLPLEGKSTPSLSSSAKLTHRVSPLILQKSLTALLTPACSAEISKVKLCLLT